MDAAALVSYSPIGNNCHELEGFRGLITKNSFSQECEYTILAVYFIIYKVENMTAYKHLKEQNTMES